MDFSLIPTAEASITTLVNSINKVIINPIIIFLFACAIAYFLYGVAQFLIFPDNEEVRKKSKSQMVSGLIGLFIMVAVFGIMTLIKNTVGGGNEIKIQQSGTVTDTSFVPSDTMGDLQSTGVSSFSETECNDSGNFWSSDNATCIIKTGVEVQAIEGGIKDTGGIQSTGVDYTYTGDPYTNTRRGWVSYTGSKNQFTGIGTSTSNANARSTKNSKLVGKYTSDASYYRIVDSGVNPVLNRAKEIALYNALDQIAKLKGLNTVTGIVYRVIEQTEFPLDKATGNYDSFIAVESPKGDIVPSTTTPAITTPSLPRR